MFTHVSQILVGYVVVYSPALVGFSMAFYIMRSNTEQFSNPFNAIIKTIVMLIGELEYEENFLWKTEEDLKFPYFPSTQILFVLFLLLGCIAIMNLLVGLAVSEIDVVREKAKEIRLKMLVKEIVRLEDLLVKKPTVLDCFPACCQKPIIRNYSLFFRLKHEMKCLRKEGKIKNRLSRFFYYNVCVRPILSKTKSRKEEKPDNSNSLLRDNANADYPVYFYSKEKGRQDEKTGFYLPKKLVLETLEWLKNNQ